MKKIASLFLLVCMLVICLASCTSIDSFERNLGKGYEIEKLTKSEIEELASEFYLDEDDYDLNGGLAAEDDESGEYAYIFECGSTKKADKLEDDLEDFIDALNDYYSVDIVVERKGKFVLIGAEDVVKDALK